MPRLHDWNPALRQGLPHVRLGSGPTPVRPLPGLGDGSAEVWLKDEGCFGDGGWGGNKVRKLEWLIPDAKRRGRGCILTFGGLGTNWGLATALYGRRHGLRVALGLVDQPVDDHVRRQLDRLRASGAELHFTRTKARTMLRAPLLIARHRSGGRPPYVLPAGGSSRLGALAYAEVALEIAGQIEAGDLPEPGHVVVAVGTGGTAAGLLLGFAIAGLPTRVVGVVVNDQLRLDRRTILGLARRAAKLLERRGRGTTGGTGSPGDRATPKVPKIREEQLILTRDWLGPGYGHPTREGELALAEVSGHVTDSAPAPTLDPVYTAKAMAALLAMNEAARFGPDPVLFINTNGPR